MLSSCDHVHGAAGLWPLPGLGIWGQPGLAGGLLPEGSLVCVCVFVYTGIPDVLYVREVHTSAGGGLGGRRGGEEARLAF